MSFLGFLSDYYSSSKGIIRWRGQKEFFNIFLLMREALLKKWWIFANRLKRLILIIWLPFSIPEREEILQSLVGYFHLKMYSSRQILATNSSESCCSWLLPFEWRGFWHHGSWNLLSKEISSVEPCASFGDTVEPTGNQKGIHRRHSGRWWEQLFVVLDRKFGDLAQVRFLKYLAFLSLGKIIPYRDFP